MHRFAVWAPHAREVSVVGDFNGWDGYAHPMWRRDDEIWVTFIPGLKNGDIYKYRVEMCIRDSLKSLLSRPFYNLFARRQKNIPQFAFAS